MAADKTPRRLGRGLDALFNTPVTTESPADTPLQDIQISRIRPNPFQPRKNFNSSELKELQESLKASGLLQPITVRPKPGGDEYELIAGERRLRAATQLGWKTISTIIKDLTDRELLGLALIENLQRADLNPIEEAEGYGRLILTSAIRNKPLPRWLDAIARRLRICFAFFNYPSMYNLS